MCGKNVAVTRAELTLRPRIEDVFGLMSRNGGFLLDNNTNDNGACSLIRFVHRTLARGPGDAVTYVACAGTTMTRVQKHVDSPGLRINAVRRFL